MADLKETANNFFCVTCQQWIEGRCGHDFLNQKIAEKDEEINKLEAMLFITWEALQNGDDERAVNTFSAMELVIQERVKKIVWEKEAENV